MEWIGPAVTAAFVSSTIAAVGLLIGRSTTLTTHEQKLEADRKLAERKVEADIDLAKAKFDYDRKQAIFRRKFELAEHILADTYRFGDLMVFVRNGFAMGNEGQTRKTAVPESDVVKKTRDAYFVPVERMHSESEFINTFMARRHAARAHFGNEADEAFDEFHSAVHLVRTAAMMLITISPNEDPGETELSRKLRRDIWQPQAEFEGNDEVGNKIKKGTEIFERLLRPALEMDKLPNNQACH